MRLPVEGRPHLTYCTNIHRGETWAEVRDNVARYVPAVRSRVAGRERFGIGLRLSARAAAELAAPAELAAFRAFLDAHDLYVFTINGFPYGPFHGTPVKERVFLPDWLDEERLVYTDRLASLLAALLPDDPELEGTVSTVPGAFKPRVRTEADAEAMVERLVRHVGGLHHLRERTGKVVALALEPEPCCYLETVAETVAFFERLLAGPALERLGRLAGLTGDERAACLRRHLGVCFDACHMAVEYEEPRAALAALATAGIRVAKIQLSAGLEVTLGRGDTEIVRAVRAFADDVYLHQVVERRDDVLTRYVDLPAALEAAAQAGDRPREWRIHFHVPLFREQLGLFRSTQPYVRELLGLVRRDAPSPHLEVETYTWDVLPAEHRGEDVVDAIAREVDWVRQCLVR